MKFWYKVNGELGHAGAGNFNEALINIYANDICQVLDIYKTVPGIKKGIESIQSIRPLSKEEHIELEERINKYGKVSLAKAKDDGYYRLNYI